MVKEIPLTQGKVALVDDKDYEYLNQWKWYASRRRYWYAVRTQYINGKPSTIFMHRLILQTPKGMETDHINHNGLDNRRCNLRICTHTENTRHQQKQARVKSSQYKGVHWQKDIKKWQACIRVNMKSVYLGLFTSEIGAAKTYDKAAKKYHGEFARTNF